MGLGFVECRASRVRLRSAEFGKTLQAFESVCHEKAVKEVDLLT